MGSREDAESRLDREALDERLMMTITNSNDQRLRLSRTVHG